ncbi:MAG: ABC transporter permease [Gemmatimonadetes bacterium]|nr:ABC transporter permease [Gemmatimonadota bacterium]
MIERFTRALRYAARSLARTPRFTLIAVFTIALGIGVDTAVFSVVDGVLLKDLTYPRSQELVNVWSSAPGLGYNQFPLSPDVYYFYRSHSHAFADMALYSAEDMSVTGNGQPERVHTVSATASLFSTLGVAPLLGRAYTPAEDVPDGPHVVVISYGLWQSRFGGDPKVLGRTLDIGDVSREIVGVMPPHFGFPRHIDLWLPLGLDAKNPPTGSFSFPAIARLAPGVTAADAQAQLVPLVKRLRDGLGEAEQYKAFLDNGHYAPLVHSMKEDLVGNLERPLWVLLGTVAFVLLIACANVANLVLIRAEVRRRESAVRTALGATRGVLIRQNAAESALLAVMGGAVGLLVAWLGVPLLLSHAPPQLPRLDGVGMNGTVVLFTLGVTALSALLFGVAPVLRYSPAALLGALKQGGRGAATGSGRRQRARNLLVAVQTALALVLLVGSGLMVRSFWSARNTDLGFDPADLLTFRLSLPQAKYATPTAVEAFHEDLLARLRALPGVESAALTSAMPLEQGAPGTTFEVEGHSTEPGQLPPMLHYRRVSPGFVKTMGIHLLAGRTLVPSDLSDGAGHVLVDRTIAERFWPGQDAVGKQLRPLNDTTRWYTVEGVVGKVLDLGVRQEPKPLVYYPMVSPDGDRGWAVRMPTYVVRARNPAALAASVRSTVWSVDSDMPIADVRTGEDLVSASVIQLSFTMFTLGIAALLALVLGAVGLYGVLSYSVAQRTQEIGVRMALGAERGVVMRMVVRDGARITVIGLLVGLAGAAALTRLLEGILYDVKALDPLTFVGTALLLLAVALLSAYLPARRAAAVDPMESMRME